jgi:hypothetical protein
MSDNKEMSVAASTITTVTAAAAALQPSESRLALSIMKLYLVV